MIRRIRSSVLALSLILTFTPLPVSAVENTETGLPVVNVRYDEPIDSSEGYLYDIAGAYKEAVILKRTHYSGSTSMIRYGVAGTNGKHITDFVFTGYSWAEEYKTPDAAWNTGSSIVQSKILLLENEGKLFPLNTETLYYSARGYDSVDTFRYGVAVVKNDGLSGAINREGHEIVAPIYNYITVSEGGMIRADNRYFDSDGDDITPPGCTAYGGFYHGFGSVMNQAGGIGWIDTTGRIVIPTNYSTGGNSYQLNGYDFGHFILRTENSVAYADASGNIVDITDKVAAIYSLEHNGSALGRNLEYISMGMATDRYILIWTRGSDRFSYLYDIETSLYSKLSQGTEVPQGTGSTVFTHYFSDNFYLTSSEFAFISTSNGDNVINKQGQLILPDGVRVQGLSNNYNKDGRYWLLQKNSNVGIIDMHTGMCTDISYSNIIFLNGVGFIVRKDGLYGLLDNDFGVVLPIEYESLQEESPYSVKGEKEGTFYLFDKSGKLIRTRPKAEGSFLCVDLEQGLFSETLSTAPFVNCFFDSTGKTLLSYKDDYTNCQGTKYGIIITKTNAAETWGAYNWRNEKEVVPHEYETLEVTDKGYIHGSYELPSLTCRHVIYNSEGEVILSIDIFRLDNVYISGDYACIPTYQGVDIYYLPGNASPVPNPTQPTVDASLYGDYYATMRKRHIRVFLQDVLYTKDGPVVTVSADNIDGEFYGKWSGGDSEVRIEVPNDYAGDITISCEGYLPQTLPADLIGNFNQIKLWKASAYGFPVLQTVLLDRTQGGYKYFENLISGTDALSVYENSIDTYDLYINVDWGTSEDHSIWLMQGSTVVALLNEGWNRNLLLGQRLKSSGGKVYIAMGGGIVTKGIAVKVLEEKPIRVGIDMGDTQEATMPESVDAIGGTKLKIDLSKLSDSIVPLKLDISDDGTVKGTIGLALDQPGGIGHSNWAFGTIKDAFKSWKNNSPSDQEVNNLIKEINKYGVPHSNTAEFGIKAEIQVLGYCEGKLDFSTWKISFQECGIITTVGGKVSYTQQATLPVIPVPIYFEAGMSLKAILTFPMELVDNHLTAKDESFKVNIAITGGTGVGVPKVVSGGVRGKGELSISGRFPYNSSRATWELSATGSFVGCIFGMSGEWEVWRSDPPWVIYKDGVWFPSADENALQLLSLSRDRFAMASREYLSDSSDFFANEPISLYDLNSAAPLLLVKNNVYTYASPQLATFSNNTKLLVWLDDVGTAARPLSSNRTALYYSYFDGESWSDPALVCEDDGRADFNPTLKCIDGTAHLVWNKADVPFESDDISINDTSLAMGISYAQFDRETRGFINHTSLTNAGDGADLMPDITTGNNVPTVIWVNNSVGDFLLAEGVSKLKKAVWAENQWIVEDLAADVSNIDSLAIRETNGEIEIYYSKDVDGNISDQSDREVFCYKSDSVNRITDNQVPDSKVAATVDGMMWYQGGELLVDGENAATVAGDDYQYVEGPNGQAAILYCRHTEDLSNLYAVINDGFGWSSEVPIAEVQGYIYACSGSFSPDGSISVAVTQWDENKVADLAIYEVPYSCNLGITYVDYDMYSLIPGKTINLTANIKNAGMSTVPVFKISVTDGTNEIYSGTVIRTIRFGEEEAVDILCTLPDALPSALTLTVSPIGVEEYNEQDNSFECQLRTSDISIEYVSAITTDEITTVFAQVANRGASELTDITVTAHLGSTDGTVLWTEQVDSILPSENINVFHPVEEALTQGELVYVTIDPTENENILNNNESFCVVQDLTVSGDDSLVLKNLGFDEENGVSGTICSNSADTIIRSLIVAAYDDHGKEMSVKVIEIFLNGFLTTQDFSWEVDGATTYKIFLLNDDYGPWLYEEVRAGVSQ